MLSQWSQLWMTRAYTKNNNKKSEASSCAIHSSVSWSCMERFPRSCVIPSWIFCCAAYGCIYDKKKKEWRELVKSKELSKTKLLIESFYKKKKSLGQPQVRRRRNAQDATRDSIWRWGPLFQFIFYSASQTELDLICISTSVFSSSRATLLVTRVSFGNQFPSLTSL